MPSELEELLECTGVGPDALDADAGGPVLSLALHCLMLSKGFHPLHGGRVAPSRTLHAPDPAWHRRGAAQWSFEYVRKNCPNVFTLYCSLRDEKMLVCAEEKALSQSGTNIHYLGLVIPKYVQNLEALREAGWAGVLTEQDVLTSYFNEYIADPLIEASEVGPQKALDGPEKSASLLESISAAMSKGLSPEERRLGLLLAGGLLMVTAAAILTIRSRSAKSG